MKRITLLTGGAVATAIVLAAGAVTVASALGAPDASRVLDDRGVDTSTISPVPTPSGTHHATPEPGDDNGDDGVVAVPPPAPTPLDRHGDPAAPDDNPGAHDQGGDDGGHGGDDRSGRGGGDRSGDDGGHGGSDDGSGHS